MSNIFLEYELLKQLNINNNCLINKLDISKRVLIYNYINKEATYANSLSVINNNNNSLLIISYIYIPNDKYYKLKIVTTDLKEYLGNCRIYMNNHRNIILDKTAINKISETAYTIYKKGIYMICIDIPRNTNITSGMPFSIIYDSKDIGTTPPDKLIPDNWKSADELLISNCNYLNIVEPINLINTFFNIANDYCINSSNLINFNDCQNYYDNAGLNNRLVDSYISAVNYNAYKSPFTNNIKCNIENILNDSNCSGIEYDVYRNYIHKMNNYCDNNPLNNTCNSYILKELIDQNDNIIKIDTNTKLQLLDKQEKLCYNIDNLLNDRCISINSNNPERLQEISKNIKPEHPMYLELKNKYPIMSPDEYSNCITYGIGKNCKNLEGNVIYDDFILNKKNKCLDDKNLLKNECLEFNKNIQINEVKEKCKINNTDNCKQLCSLYNGEFNDICFWEDNKVKIFILFIFLIVCAVVGGKYYYNNYRKKQKNNTNNN